MDKTNNILLFDGVCNLCNKLVLFVIKRDKNNKIKFASLQSEAGRKILLSNNFCTNNLSSFVFIKQNRVLIKSTAALNLSKEIGGIWQLLYVFIIVPKFIRDLVYDIVAKNRYSWFGKQNECMVPTKELMNKFLVD
ncbi:MAG: thiol-disulfide oxidoreductase DCC family protein [Chitinophagaceae bacterium]